MELDRIIITGARQHNLKNVTVEIPKKKLVILTGVSGSGKVKGRASLSLAFTQLIASGKTYTLGARRISLLAPETHGKDAKIIGGGAGAGALVGAIADGKSGAAKGALVGGAAGTGAVLATRGKEVSIPAGSHWRVRLVRPLVVD